MIAKLKESIPGIEFNGNALHDERSLYTILSISLPKTDIPVLSLLDSHLISASGGSACTSHLTSRSHVLEALGFNFDRTAIRFSFSRNNISDEIDYAVDKLADGFNVKLAINDPESDTILAWQK